MEDKSPQGKNESAQKKIKPPQEGRHPFPASFHNIPLEILLLREDVYGGLSEDRSRRWSTWFPELQLCVEKETSPRKEQILPRDE